MDIYKLIPKVGALRKWVAQKEKEARQTFNLDLNLRFVDATHSIAIDAVCKLVSDVLTIPVPLILGGQRDVEIREARHITMYLCKKHIPDVTENQIADYLKKDRSSVHHAVDKINSFLKVNDCEITSKVADCETELLKRIND
jgi:chromosomal replication initiation ATPase DnaA